MDFVWLKLATSCFAILQVIIHRYGVNTSTLYSVHTKRLAIIIVIIFKVEMNLFFLRFAAQTVLIKCRSDETLLYTSWQNKYEPQQRQRWQRMR